MVIANQANYGKNICTARVISSQTLPECANESIEPVGKCGPLVAKIPVVLAETRIQIDVESLIELAEPALEIKRVKKNLFLTQCKLVTLRVGKECKDEKDKKCGFGKLFIRGFIRKNIEYATMNCKFPEKGCISGDIHHTTCLVPFECVTEIKFVHPPEINKSSMTSEGETFAAKMNMCDVCSEPILMRDPCEQSFKHSEHFTEKVFCELVSVKILEEDIQEDTLPLDGKCSFEHVFNNFTEKMVIFLKLKLLQNQQVNIVR